MSASMTLTGMSSGPTTGAKTTLLITDIAAGTVSETIDATLTVGDNWFPVPPGASRVAVTLPSTTTAVTLRTDANIDDDGLPITPYGGTPFASFPLPAGITTVILNSAASVAGVEVTFI